MKKKEEIIINDKKSVNHKQETDFNRQEFNDVIRKIELLKDMKAVDAEAALREIKGRLSKQRSFNYYKLFQKIAAVIVLPLLFFALWQGAQLLQIQNSLVQNTISTPPTMRSHFLLPDGTKVWLNGETSLTYPTAFTQNERLVELTGEAYFEVAPNRSKPFIVKTGNMFVEAVGTEFNCMAYPDDKYVETVLTEGEVNILYAKNSQRQKVLSLQPGQMASFEKDNIKFFRKTVDTYKYTAWLDGKMVFQNDYLENVITRLERWYNVDFTVDPKLKKAYSFTGSFENEELSQILNYIELTTPVEFTIEDKKQGNDKLYNKTQIDITLK